VWELAVDPNDARGAPASVAVRLFGPFRVVRNGSAAELPASRKVRALLAYLAMAPRPVHRDRLCEIFWDVPNDPRSELRWCLTKIRGLLDEPSQERVKAGKDWVSIDASTLEVDALWVAERVEVAISGGDLDLLKQLAAKFEGEFLEGFEADRIPLFETWLIGERQRFQRFHADVLSRIAALLPSPQEALPYIRKRLDVLPFDEAVHRDLMAALAACGRFAEGEAHLEAATHLLRSQGLSSTPLEKAWREHRQLAARGTRPESPPLSVAPTAATETESDRLKEPAFHAEREEAEPPHLSIVATAPPRTWAEVPMASGRIERKLVAIVAADVAGFSRLMAADEESTVTRLKAHREALLDPKIAEYGGRIIKITSDGMLVQFASVVDAVRCVVEIQRGMLERNADVPKEKRIDFRVGVNVGDVIVDGDDIYGDGVDVVARLEDLAEPGGVLVAGAVRDQVRDKLGFSFDDLGDRDVKNIPRPVRAYRVELGDEERPPPLARLSKRLGVGRSQIAWIGAAGLLLIVVASGGAWYVAGGPKAAATVVQQSALLTLAEPAKRPSQLSIVVLPFANLSGDANQDYFADGVTESLTTSLSRLRGFFVIARNTAFTFKGKNVDVREIGKELGVHYVLEGSIQRDQSQVRANVQLIDAENGGHIWAGRFDGGHADLFEMQDQIVAGLGEQLRTELIADEARRAQRASTPDSMDLYFQGQAWYNKGLNRENLAQARSFFESALALDPDNFSALTARANVDLIFAGSYMVDDRAARLAAIEATVTKLLAQAPNNAFAHYLMCAVQIRTNRGAEAIAECERALTLNPNLANVHAQIGFACLVNGRPEETESHIREAIAASPRDTNMYIWMGYIATAKLYSGADEEAVAWFRRTLEFNRSYAVAHFYLSGALELLGRHNDAQAEVQAGLALDPQFTIRRFRAGAQSDNPTFRRQRERIIQAMQEAGIPEG
jgi:TolB-like protein/class 3 adenylate cyclase/DNA-binding SARP family transcriptional activator